MLSYFYTCQARMVHHGSNVSLWLVIKGGPPIIQRVFLSNMGSDESIREKSSELPFIIQKMIKHMISLFLRKECIQVDINYVVTFCTSVFHFFYWFHSCRITISTEVASSISDDVSKLLFYTMEVIAIDVQELVIWAFVLVAVDQPSNQTVGVRVPYLFSSFSFQS